MDHEEASCCHETFSFLSSIHVSYSFVKLPPRFPQTEPIEATGLGEGKDERAININLPPGRSPL